MSGDSSPCERCGAPAQIHITSEWTGASGMRHLCLDCAETEQAVRKRRKRAFNLGAVFIVVGGALILASVFADQLHAGVAGGFGAWQIAAILAAVVLTGVGAVLRIPTVMAIGPCVAAIVLLVPEFGLGEKPGFGRRQLYGCLLGLGMILLGTVIVVLRKKWAERIQHRSTPAASRPKGRAVDQS